MNTVASTTISSAIFSGQEGPEERVLMLLGELDLVI